MSGQGPSAGKNSNMSMTVGKNQPQDAGAASDDKKSAAGKDGATPGGAAKGGLSKMKDPNGAHETLEMAKNEKAP